MKSNKYKLWLVAMMLVTLAHAQYPSIKRNDLKAADKGFERPVDKSKDGELTILSFNIKDVRGTTRTLRDFQEIADIIDEADIVVFQELGAKGYNQNPSGVAKMEERFLAMVSVYQMFLGEHWQFAVATEHPTPKYLGSGAELPLVAYKVKSNKMEIDVSWDSYHDLGDYKRDMGLFNVKCKQGNDSIIFNIGTVHTSPKCEDGRGLQLTEIGKYAQENTNENFVVLGDFNFGYDSSTSCHEDFPGYSGEDYLRDIHDEGIAFLVFNEFSYYGNGKETDFRTNLNKRKDGHMYDQFLVSNSLADKMADGGSLLQDCGWLSFSDRKYFEDIMDKEVKAQLKGFKNAMKHYGDSFEDDEGKALLKEKAQEIYDIRFTVDVATNRLSDHKPIWIQFKLFEN